MKYIKGFEDINEAIIHSKKIDPKHLHEVKNFISNYFPCEILPSDKKYDSYDSALIKIETEIGDINIYFNLKNSNNNKPITKNKIIKPFKSTSLKVDLYYNDKMQVSSYISNNIEDIELTSLIDNINFVIERNKKSEEENKAIERFSKELKDSDIEDLFMELSDLAGKYEIFKYKGAKHLKFTCPISIFDSSRDFIIPNDNYIEIISEINSINHRLKAFGSKLKFSFKQNRNNCILTIIISYDTNF